MQPRSVPMIVLVTVFAVACATTPNAAPAPARPATPSTAPGRAPLPHASDVDPAAQANSTQPAVTEPSLAESPPSTHPEPAAAQRHGDPGARSSRGDHLHAHGPNEVVEPNQAIAPSDRSDPEAVAVFVAAALVNRSRDTEPFTSQVREWVTPELAALYTPRSADAVDVGPVRGDIVATNITSTGPAIEVAVTVEQVAPAADVVEARLFVVHAVLNQSADGWRVASLEFSP